MSKSVVAAAIALLPNAVFAAGLQLGGGGALPAAQIEDALDPAVERALMREAAANEQRLALPPISKSGSALQWPMLLDAGLPGTDRTGTSGYVDLDPAFPSRLRDHNCGQRTYDTENGYNHGGTDLFLWPFSWQGMAQEAVSVVAAAPGTIVLRRDGNFDRNCSFDSPDTPNLVFVRHDDGTLAWYLHLKNGSLTPKNVGERVQAGEYLGKVGSSGISSGPHLHFELRASTASNAPVIDPYAGQCNAVTSRWAQQPSDRYPRLEMLGVHDAPPEFFFADCNTTERPHHQRWFRPGQQVILAAYYGDQKAGLPTTVVMRRPDGSEFNRFTFTPTTTQLSGSEYLSASYFYFTGSLPADAPSGLWEASMTYEGVTRTEKFAVGEPIFNASGIWFDPAQAGHGFTAEVIEAGGTPQLAIAWFTYLDGQPRWIYGIGPIANGRATVQAQISRGGQFPPAFDPSAVVFEPWGTLTFSFTTTDSGRVEWSSTRPGFNNGAMNLSRLATPADVNLDDVDTGMRACASGSWYVSSQSGHGLQLQVADVAGVRQLLVAWYVYRDGQQVWLSGAGPIVGKRATVALNVTSGGQFPPAFNPAAATTQPWGTATFDLVDTGRMQLNYSSTIPGFGSGTLQLERLTELLTAECL